MIITALTDLHGDLSGLSRISEILAGSDMVLLTGDLTHFGRRAAAEKVVQAVRAFNPKVFAVPGNCDEPEVEVYLTEEGINLHGRHIVLDGITFLGLGGSLPCPGTTPNEMTEEEVEAVLEAAARGIDPALPLVLVCHQPPRGTVADRLKNGAHVGSLSLRRFIEAREPLVCFSGHIHEGCGIDDIGATKVVNPGPLRFGGHAVARMSTTLEEVEIRGI